MHIAQAQQVLLGGAAGVHFERIPEEKHQIHLIAGHAGSDLLDAAQFAGEVTVDRQAGGLGQHPACGAGGNDRVAGQDAAVRGTELECEFLAGIVCKNGNCHVALSFVLSIVLWMVAGHRTGKNCLLPKYTLT